MGGLLAWEVIGVIDTEGDCVEWTFPADPGAVRAARTAVRERLRAWNLDGLADIAALLVSELVTNSLRHATGPIGVRLVRPGAVGGVLLVEVSDPLPEPDADHGRGLQLVAHAAHRWGTRPGTTGKTVWFELSVP